MNNRDRQKALMIISMGLAVAVVLLGTALLHHPPLNVLPL